MKDISLKKKQIPVPGLTLYSKYVAPNINGEIFQGDALAFFSTIKDDVASIIFLDPPFNLGKITVMVSNMISNPMNSICHGYATS